MIGRDLQSHESLIIRRASSTLYPFLILCPVPARVGVYSVGRAHLACFIRQGFRLRYANLVNPLTVLLSIILSLVRQYLTIIINSDDQFSTLILATEKE